MAGDPSSNDAPPTAPVPTNAPADAAPELLPGAAAPALGAHAPGGESCE